MGSWLSSPSSSDSTSGGAMTQLECMALGNDHVYTESGTCVTKEAFVE